MRYTWVFNMRNKKPPIDILLWFIEQMRQHFRFAVTALRTDEGGELWESHQFRVACGKVHTIVECTGGYASSLNGKVEVRHKLTKRTTASCLFAAGQRANMWCYANVFSAWVLNVLPSKNLGWDSSYLQLMGKQPDLSKLRVYGSSILVLDRQPTCSSSDRVHKNKEGTFIAFNGTLAIISYIDQRGAVRKAADAVIDELCSTLPVEERTPASKLIMKKKRRN